jgi:hypothetical protein
MAKMDSMVRWASIVAAPSMIYLWNGNEKDFTKIKNDDFYLSNLL